MPALVVLQPAWLTAATVLATFVAVTARSARRGRRPVIALVSGALAGASTGLLASVLVLQEQRLAPWLLLSLAAAVAALLVLELYRHARRPLPRLAAGLRWLAWCCAIVLVARPACDRTVVAWERPLLAVVLDCSLSMQLVDPGVSSAQSRAERVNRAFAQNGPLLTRIEELFDVQRRALGDRSAPLSEWQVVPAAPLSGLAAALRAAATLRSGTGEPAHALLLISDGAENVAEDADVLDAAQTLADHRTIVWMVGAGPFSESLAHLELEPLAVPARVGLRELLPVPVRGRALHCAGRDLRIEVLWDDVPAAEARLTITRADEPFAIRLDVAPPAVGLHRLAARVYCADTETLSARSERILDVRSERVAVLWLEQAPRPEATFALRALRTDPQLEITARFLLNTPRAALDSPGLWSGYDVVVLGRVNLPQAAAQELVRAVMQRGVGVMLAPGAADVLQSPGPLADILPGTVVPAPLATALRFQPTPAGLRHPVFAGTANAVTSVPATGPMSAQWAALPALSASLALVQAKPAAAVLATEQRPLLIAQEVGRGRVLLGGWEATWHWALASQEAALLHAQFWRQIGAWLANRRPQAWVLTDRGTYSRAMLAAHEQTVEIRGGLSGAIGPTVPANGGAERDRVGAPRFRLQRAGAPGWQLELTGRPAPQGWVAAWPTPGAADLPADRYDVEFSFDSDSADPENAPRARTQFTILDENLELRSPTANLQLLRTAARRAAGAGGGYVNIEDLAPVLTRLAETDHRTRIERRTQLDPVSQHPGPLFGLLLLLLAAEWVLRKRAGLI